MAPAKTQVRLEDVLGVDKASYGETNTLRRTEIGSGRAVYIPKIEPAIEPPPPQLGYSFPNQYWRLPKNHEDLVTSLKWAARDRLSGEVTAPEWVTIELARQDKGPLLLHLVNYKPKVTVQDIWATIRPPANFRIKEAVLVTPENLTEQKLALTPDRDSFAMIIPSRRVYALVTMRLEEI